MKNISVNLTEEERSYLIITLNIELRRPTASIDYIVGHNKLFRALTGKNHERYIAWQGKGG